MNNNISRAFKSSISTYLSTIVLMATGMLMPVVLVRYLSVEDFGSFKLISSLLFAGTAITSFGIQATIGRFVPDLVANKRYRAVNKLLIISILVRFLSAGIFILVLWHLMQDIFGFFNFPDIFFMAFFPISAIVILALTNAVIGPAYLNALMQHHINSYNVIIYSSTKLVFFCSCSIWDMDWRD